MKIISNAKEAHIRYSELSNQEHILLKQRAKVHWLTNSVNDLKFLYTSVKERNNSNIIRMIHSSKGILTTQIDIATCFCDHFYALFTSQHFILSMHFDLPIGSIISQAHYLMLEVNIYNEEILCALRDINENKFPGVDGFNSHFF